MSRFIHALREINAIVMLSLLMTGMLLTLMQFDTTSAFSVYEVLWVPVYIIITYFISCYVNKVFVSTVLLLAFGLIIIPFSGTLSHTIFNAIVLGIIIIRTLYGMARDSDTAVVPPGAELVFLFFFFYLFARHYKVWPLPTVIVVFCLAYLFLALLSVYLKNLSRYLNQNRDFTDVSMSSLVKTDTIVFGVFVALIFTGVILFFFVPVDEIAADLKDGFYALIKKPIEAVLFLIALTPDIDYQELQVDFEEYFKDAKPLFDSSIWKLPELVLKAFIYYFICKIIIRFIYSIIVRLKGSHIVMHDEITYKRPSLKVVRNVRQASNVKKQGKRSNAMRVREEFIRLVKEHEYTASHIFKSATPKTIVETMRIEDGEDKRLHDYDAIRDVYEKARYSDCEVTKEDVNVIRKA